MSSIALGEQIAAGNLHEVQATVSAAGEGESLCRLLSVTLLWEGAYASYPWPQNKRDCYVFVRTTYLQQESNPEKIRHCIQIGLRFAGRFAQNLAPDWRPDAFLEMYKMLHVTERRAIQIRFRENAEVLGWLVGAERELLFPTISR